MADPFHRDNHFIPRMYLKPWETPDGKIWTYRILVQHENVPIWQEPRKSSRLAFAFVYAMVAGQSETGSLDVSLFVGPRRTSLN